MDLTLTGFLSFIFVVLAALIYGIYETKQK